MKVDVSKDDCRFPHVVHTATRSLRQPMAYMDASLLAGWIELTSDRAVLSIIGVCESNLIAKRWVCVRAEDRLHGCSGPYSSDRNAALMPSANDTELQRTKDVGVAQSQFANERCHETEGLPVSSADKCKLYTPGPEPSLVAHCERRHTHPSIKGQTPSGCCGVRLWCGCPQRGVPGPARRGGDWRQFAA